MSYVTELKHCMLEGCDRYPTTLDSAFNIMLRRKVDKVPWLVQDGVPFTTVAGGNGRVYNTKCHKCNQMGHYASHCLHAASETEGGGEIAATAGEGIKHSFAMTMRNKQTGKPLWLILLDSQATLDITCNAKLLRNIWTADHVMYIHCHAGVLSMNQQGYLPGCGVV